MCKFSRSSALPLTTPFDNLMCPFRALLMMRGCFDTFFLGFFISIFFSLFCLLVFFILFFSVSTTGDQTADPSIRPWPKERSNSELHYVDTSDTPCDRLTKTKQRTHTTRPPALRLQTEMPRPSSLSLPLSHCFP